MWSKRRIALALVIAGTLVTSASSFRAEAQAATRRQPPKAATAAVAGPLPRWLRPVMLRACRTAHVPTSWVSSRGLYEILLHESSFNPHAKNPSSTAYGLFQFLDSTWSGVGGHRTSDAYLQCVYGLRYMRQRYHNPTQAWAFWAQHHWY